MLSRIIVWPSSRWMPETPQFLLSKNRRHEAERSLRWLRGPDADLSAELEDMQKDVSALLSNWNSKYVIIVLGCRFAW